MIIVLKTRELDANSAAEAESMALAGGLVRLSRGDPRDYGFTVVCDPAERMLVYFDHVEDWMRVVAVCDNFLKNHQPLTQYLSGKTEVYFDIGIDNSEISGSFYHEFFFPRAMMVQMAQAGVSFVLTLYQLTLRATI